MLLSYNQGNLRKNKVTKDEVEQVILSDTTIDFQMTPSNFGNDRTMLVGFTLSGRILEIGIEFLPDTLHVFHANDATKAYQQKFRERIRS